MANVSLWTISMTLTVISAAKRNVPFTSVFATTAPATILAPILGGWVVDTAGFIPTFSISIVLSIVMIGILIFLVKTTHVQATANCARYLGGP